MKALPSAEQRPEKVRGPQPKDAVKKRLETAPPWQRQLRCIKGPDGLLNPEESLLLSVFKIG
jgi:hypothetical protein